MSDSVDTIGVLICTYRRPENLARGLAALETQQRRPDDVMVVVRDTDAATHGWLAAHRSPNLPLRIVSVTRPGTVAALNAGLDACRTAVLAITDDDTVPWPGWLARIFEHFQADPALGGLGGRDRCHDGERFDDRKRDIVGHIQWFGRLVSNHHLGHGAPRSAKILKGANMSYRATAFAGIRFDGRLLGTGAQSAEDSTFSLAVRRAGWKLLYDPAVGVDHYAAVRSDARHYVGVSKLEDPEGFRIHAYNGVVLLWDELSLPRHVAYFAWALLIGTGTCPGLLQALRYTPHLGLASWERFRVAQQGRAAAYWTLLRAGRSAPNRLPPSAAAGEQAQT